MMKTETEILDLQKHLDLLNRDLKRKNREAMVCQVCGGAAGKKGARYCVVCGSDRLLPGRPQEMFYQPIPTDESGKAAVCPHCDNEDLTTGDYCMICGNNVVNQCADTPDGLGGVVKSCRTILPGNARFCPKCGNESSFYQKGWLRDWRSENTRRAIENINMTVDFNDLQDGKTRA